MADKDKAPPFMMPLAGGTFEETVDASLYTWLLALRTMFDLTSDQIRAVALRLIEAGCDVMEDALGVTKSAAEEARPKLMAELTELIAGRIRATEAPFP